MPPSGIYNVVELSTASTVGISTSVPVAMNVIDATTFTSGVQVSTVTNTARTFPKAMDAVAWLHTMNGAQNSGTQVGNGQVVADAQDGKFAMGVIPMVAVNNGVSYNLTRTPNTFKNFNAVASSSATAVWTPAAGKKFRLMGFLIAASSAGDVLLQDSTAAASGSPATIFRFASGTGGPGITPAGMGNGIVSTSTNNLLTVTAPTTTATVSGTVWGTEE